MHQVNITITGRVQRVGFRYWVRNIARKLGVNGIVRNLDNGGLEVIAQSDEDTLRVFVNTISDGPPLALVKEVKTKWVKPREKFEGFEILR